MGDRTSLILALMLGLIVLSVVDGATGTSKVVNASEILAKIQNGEQIEYNGVTILGDLDLSKLDLPTIHVNRTYIESIEGVPSEVKVVASPLDITKSQINGNVTFDNGYFISPINLKDTNISGNVSFSRSRFQSYVDFTGTQIGSIAYLGLAQFNGDAYFGDVQFSGDANFQYTRFNGTTNFAEVRFGRKADFNNAHFSGNTFFTQSQFIGNAYFFGSQFISKDVDWVFPRGIANFDLTQFNNYTDFSGAQFSGDADFKGANFAKDLKLNYAGFYNLNLLNVSFKPSALVSLSDGEFMRSDSSRILVRWDSIKNHLVYNELAYLYLIRNFKSLGFFDDADDCYYEYRWNKMFSQTSFFGSLGDIISWASCGYGIGWINTVASAIFMIFLFGIIFSKHFCWDLRNAMWASAIVMLSLPAEWFPFGKDQYENFIKYHRKLAAFERLMGWSLLIILISTLSRIMIRY